MAEAINFLSRFALSFLFWSVIASGAYNCWVLFKSLFCEALRLAAAFEVLFKLDLLTTDVRCKLFFCYAAEAVGS